ncbi:protein sly1 homolog [Nymphalis io]|uniref:protein sly1 homolog n=1 Tax=Inachis io TaxID=171585 RepID=UPI002169163F|nr:protein sly1 homolog [Nymphalis io]
MTTLRERQLNALKQMLNLNQPLTKAVATEPTWKVLIYDRVGQDIISPLISVKELRELGVTIHVQLHSDRDSIPEVPAVYFCAPTEENLGRICQDLDNGIYDQYHLNFISPITRQKLEDLAASAIQSNSVMSIHKVFDQYLNFICLEDDLFIMKHQQSDSLSYYAINKGDTKDTEMEAIMDEIVESLFSVFVTLGNVPIIRCSKGNAAEMVAKKLDKKLRENLWDARNNLFHGQAGTFSFTRPMLILLDRNMDMATPLHHTWTYQALAHDVLDLSLNRAVVPESSAPIAPGQKAKTRICDLDSKDPLWSEHKGSPFPTVAEAIQEDLDKYRSSEAEVKKLKSSMGLDADSDLALSLVSDNTQRLTSAVNSLPQLMEKKRLIDMHTTIATAILNAIKSRRLDSFFELEEKIMSKSSGVESKAVMDLITDPSAGTAEDKMRLFIIYYLCATQIMDDDYEKFESALLAANCDIKPMSYMKRWKGFTKMSSQGQYEGGGTKTVSMFSKLVSQGSSFVMEGVKNLVVKKHKLPVSRTVETALGSSGAGDNELAWLDPRAARTDGGARARAPRHPPPTDAVVFLVGGGSYIEYHNLIDFAKQQAASGITRKIIYGATTLPNAFQFLKQLSLLGEELQ